MNLLFYEFSYQWHHSSVINSVGITNKLMGVPPWRAIAGLENFLGCPFWKGPNFCKFYIMPTTDFHNGKVNKSCARESQLVVTVSFWHYKLNWNVSLTTPVTIHCSQACKWSELSQCFFTDWPRHQWVVSPAGMCRPAARTTHSTLLLDESVQLHVFDTLSLLADISWAQFSVQFFDPPCTTTVLPCMLQWCTVCCKSCQYWFMLLTMWYCRSSCIMT